MFPVYLLMVLINGKEYIIQPEYTEELVMYQSEPEVIYLCRIPIPKDSLTIASDRIRCAVGEEQKNSGMSIWEWCESKQLSKDAYYYWKKKIQKEALSENTEEE